MASATRVSVNYCMCYWQYSVILFVGLKDLYLAYFLHVSYRPTRQFCRRVVCTISATLTQRKKSKWGAIQDSSARSSQRNSRGSSFMMSLITIIVCCKIAAVVAFPRKYHEFRFIYFIFHLFCHNKNTTSRDDWQGQNDSNNNTYPDESSRCYKGLYWN